MTSPSTDKDIKQLKFSYTMGRKGNGIISSENWSFLEKLNMYLTITQPLHSQMFTQENSKFKSTQRLVYECPQQFYV